MTDTRVLIAIAILGVAAVAGKAYELWAWHVKGRPLIDTANNGGVSSYTLNG